MIAVPRLEARTTRLILDRLGPVLPPEYVDVEAWAGARKNECFEDVGRRVAIDGGRAVVGWAFWKSELLVEAEYHCVWMDASGRKVDIAQRELPFGRILFVEDGGRPYTGRQVDNLRVNLSANPVVDCLIQAYECVFMLENRGERSLESRVVLTGMEAALHKYFTMLKGKLELYAYGGATIDSPCFCDSRKPFHSCHQDDICKAVAKVKRLTA